MLRNINLGRNVVPVSAFSHEMSINSQSSSYLFCIICGMLLFPIRRAWSEIVYSLIPNVELLESQLDDFTSICAADEVVLFERATFLVISHVSKFK